MNETQRRRALADVKEFFLRTGALAALLLVLFGVVFGLAIQPDDTMYPHLKPGDLLLYYRLPRSFAAGEVCRANVPAGNQRRQNAVCHCALPVKKQTNQPRRTGLFAKL